MEVILVALAIIAIIALCLWFFPVWNVWASRKSGEAEFEQSRSEQRTQLSEASARLEAAEINKKAAVIEAEAVALQIKTIGTQLTTHDLYLKWQWIKMMEEREGETIYVPTEAGLPILEAGNRKRANDKEE